MRTTLLWTAAIVLGLAPVSSKSQATPSTPAAPPAPTVDVVMAYAGTWKVQGERFATPHSEAGKENSTLHNVCQKNGSYVACNQYVNGESRVLLVFTYSEKEKMFNSYQIPLAGGDPGKGKLQINGNVWTFPWQITAGGQTVYFRVVNVFTGTDHIDYRQEFSVDNVNWIAMAKGSETKTANE